MKTISKSRILLVLGAALAMLLFAGVAVGGRIREATEHLAEQRDALTTERERLSKINDARADYENQTRRFDAAYEEMTGNFPAEISQNNQILFLRDVEDEFGVQIASASYTNPEMVYQFKYLPPGNAESYRLMRSTIQFPVSLPYGEWKRFISYIEETDGRDVIETVVADYDREQSVVDADVTISQYAVTGSDRADAEQTTEVELGTDNIFSSGSSFYTGETGAGDGYSYNYNYNYNTDYSYGAGYSYQTEYGYNTDDSTGDLPINDAGGEGIYGEDATVTEPPEGADAYGGGYDEGAGYDGAADDGSADTSSGIRSSIR